MVSDRRLVRDHAALISLVTRSLDAIAIAGVALLAYILRFGEFSPLPKAYIALVAIGVLLSLVLFPAFGVYRSWRGNTMFQLFSRLFAAWGTVLIILVSMLFLLKASADYSRIWFTYWATLSLVSLFTIRGIVYLTLCTMRRRGWNHKRVVLLGAGAIGRSLARRLRHHPEIGFNVVAMLDDQPSLHGKRFAGAPVVGTLDKVNDIAQEHDADEIWIALPLSAEPRVRAILNQLSHTTYNIRYIPDIFCFSLLNHAVSEIAGIPVLDLNVSPMDGSNRIIKAIEDRMLALLILILISPLLIIIAIGVKLSSEGPVIFKQLRHGWDGKPIKVYKFRTMKVHTETNGRVTQATKNDPRVTKFGAFLRRTSLDELPQFFNVLQGRMSIVGPRPHALAHNEYYKNLIQNYMLRHKVKPGITGWAQINGLRGETDTLEKMKKRVEYDLYYINNWSLLLDFKIIFKTITNGFINEHAY